VSQNVKFIYKPLTGSHHEVFLAGDFNNWNPTDLKLTEKNGIYEINLFLEEGTYCYKFVVDGFWIVDDSASDFCFDEYNNKNSLIKIGKFSQNKNIINDDFDTPDWVKNGIIYQIFPDRFCNGNPEINPDFKEWYYQKSNILSEASRKNLYEFVEDWNDYKKLNNAPNKHFLFYGGDLEGLRQKIDYLVDLGITIIYFNPLVQSPSNHKYAALDFLKIDPHFGTNEEFRQIMDLLHSKGIRTIVDFAFNHVGIEFFAFQDSLKNGPKSKYYNWFEWKKWPIPNPLPDNFQVLDYYQCWWGHSTMPDLNYDLSRNHPDENYIKDIEKADVNWDIVNHIEKVVEFWLTDLDIDGFRLDIPNEVPFWFWEIFRKKVKSIKKDAYLVGEIWHNAHEWVNDKYFDAVMNYNYFRDPMYNYFITNELSTQEFMGILKTGLSSFPNQANQVMMNLLDSHDTFRCLETLQNNIQIYKLMIIFQMTYPGTPHIFYGDEIGMRGGYDPDNRRPFNWNYQTNENLVDLRKHFKNLIRIRKQHKSLVLGKFREIKSAIVSFSRKFEGENLFILINKTDSEKEISLDSNKKFFDLLSEKEIKTSEGKVKVQAESGMILKEIP